MSRKHDLEKLIRTSYNIIHSNESIIQTAEPKESARLKSENEEQWRLIEGYLTEYIPLSERSNMPIPDDIHEIAVHFPNMLVQTRSLDQHLNDLVRMFLAESFERDQYIELDQAGETDPQRSTLLQRVFVDLEVKIRQGPQPPRIKQGQISFVERNRKGDIERESFFALPCLLEEVWPMITIIGGPGQGKSTLGQHLAQVHRASLLNKEWEFKPKLTRVPFRVVLKYFAQWLTDNPSSDTVDTYLAERMQELTSRPVSAANIQEICRCHPCLIIFDGLDEVVDPTLRAKMMSRLEGFLARLEQLQANVQVLATSRPTGYQDHFDPERFGHLELRPLSPERVKIFAQKWVDTKKLREEERRRVLRTLAECQEDEALSGLLTTPLQVMIVLLIIKDGGRPPSQREALFDAYWGMIYRRERSKAQNIIQTDEAELFQLHAYLGYFLQRRAASENVQSLFPEAEFRETVYNFLQRQDRVSPSEVLRQKTDRLVTEANERLVLLVEPLPGLFGFELRSLQEFFAAVHLFQTAANLEQRFNRLKAIACSNHWRNVALFFAGRVARLLEGEASNILGWVCQPVDREGVDFYLRRGAWLALDIAADGVFTTKRDLQYNAVEYALTVLRMGLVDEQQDELEKATARLSKEDQRDILKPALEARLRSLPPACLEPALALYGKRFGATPFFQDRLDDLIRSGREQAICAAFKLAFEHEVEPSWLMEHLGKHWPVWADQFRGWWLHSPEHAAAVLRTWSPPVAAINQLGYLLFSEKWSFRYYPEHSPIPLELDLLPNLESPLEQLLLTLRCEYIILAIFEMMPRTGIDIRSDFGGVRLVWPIDQDDTLATTATIPSTEAILEVLAQSTLTPWLRVRLWLLVWRMAYQPDPVALAQFLQDAQNLQQFASIPEWLWRYLLGSRRPLLAHAVTLHLAGNIETAARLASHLCNPTLSSITTQAAEIVSRFAEDASAEENNQLFKAVRYGLDLPLSLSSNLAPLASTLDLTPGELVDIYPKIWISGRGDKSLQFTTVELQTLLSRLAQKIEQPNAKLAVNYEFLGVPWSDEPDLYNQVMNLLDRILSSCLPPQHKFELEMMIVLFFKLLAWDAVVLQKAPRFFSILKQATETKQLPDWSISFGLAITSPERAKELITFLEDEDETVREGAINFWTMAIEISFRGYHFISIGEAKTEWVQEICFDWEMGLSLLWANDPIRHRQGIRLLTFSNYPLSEAPRQQFLLEMMRNTKSVKEDEVWAQFLDNFPVQAGQEAYLRDMLENILAYPQHYSSPILSSAMERYRKMAESEVVYSLEQHEAELGLP